MAMHTEAAEPSMRDRLFGKDSLAPGHHPELHTPQHAVMIMRALHGFYRRMALCRLIAVQLWEGALITDALLGPPGRFQTGVHSVVALTLATGALATVGAVAAWSHHHEGVQDWMSGRRVLNRISDYLRRTARERRVSADIPGLIEGASVLAMAACTAWTAPPAQQGASVLWSAAFTFLLLYFPFSQYVIDPAWYQPGLARRAGYAWFRFAIPLVLAVTGIAVYRACAPASASGPDGAIVIAGLMFRLYVDVSLVNALLGALPDALRDQREELAEAVSTVVHSKIKNELRVLGPNLELESRPSWVQASWHSLVHQVESLRRHPFREGDGTDIGEIIEDVRSTAYGHAADSAAIDLSVESTGVDVMPLRATDLNLLQIVLSDLCANSVREANRLRRSSFRIWIFIRAVEEERRRRLIVTVEDEGDGFDGDSIMNRPESSLAILNHRLKRLGGGITIDRTPAGTRVQATWLAL